MSGWTKSFNTNKVRVPLSYFFSNALNFSNRFSGVFSYSTMAWFRSLPVGLVFIQVISSLQ